ncbi:MAG: toxin-antitoxin system HicB family antitoxin [Armatimonadetes bacterium]|nr:toxin-antitoxin system HicB family antitoxin [Armatimonadota bacterium]
MSATQTGRDADYYLNLRYPVTLRELAPEEGGGYVAAIPQLGVRTFVAVGETPGEALEALDALRRHLIPELLAEGVELPEPQDERHAIEQYSGNLVLRIPRGLHARLAEEAKRNGCSLNKLATQLLAEGLERARVTEELHRVLAGLAQPALPAGELPTARSHRR